MSSLGSFSAAAMNRASLAGRLERHVRLVAALDHGRLLFFSIVFSSTLGYAASIDISRIV
jgi:hypothetical protein